MIYEHVKQTQKKTRMSMVQFIAQQNIYLSISVISPLVDTTISGPESFTNQCSAIIRRISHKQCGIQSQYPILKHMLLFYLIPQAFILHLCQISAI